MTTAQGNVPGKELLLILKKFVGKREIALFGGKESDAFEDDTLVVLYQ